MTDLISHNSLARNAIFCLKRFPLMLRLKFAISWDGVVAQLAEQSLLKPETSGLNLITGKNFECKNVSIAICLGKANKNIKSLK